jgi:hypothetical protein
MENQLLGGSGEWENAWPQTTQAWCTIQPFDTPPAMQRSCVAVALERLFARAITK